MHIPTAAPVPAKPLPIYRQLYFQVIVAIVLGAILGHYEPLIGEKMKPLGDAFINLVKMIIAPVIFLTIVTGIAGMTHLRTVGRCGGEQQFVVVATAQCAVARAIAAEPAVILADEPTGNLDAATGQQVIDLMFDLNAKQGTTLLLVTHDEAIAARCGRILRIQSGRLA